MSAATKFRAYLKGLNVSENFFVATVVSVDKNNDSCVVAVDNLEYKNVLLRANTEGGKGIKCYPKKQSEVLIQRADGLLLVIMYSELEEWTLGIDTATISMTDKIEIAKGSETLLGIIEDLVKEISVILPAQGTPPNVPALQAIVLRAKQIFK